MYIVRISTRHSGILYSSPSTIWVEFFIIYPLSMQSSSLDPFHPFEICSIASYRKRHHDGIALCLRSACQPIVWNDIEQSDPLTSIELLDSSSYLSPLPHTSHNIHLSLLFVTPWNRGSFGCQKSVRFGSVIIFFFFWRIFMIYSEISL